MNKRREHGFKLPLSSLTGYLMIAVRGILSILIVTNNKGNVPIRDNRNIPLFNYCFIFILSSTRTVPYCYFCMYRTLRNPEFLCCLPHRRPIFHNIIGNLDSPLFDICFQKTTPCILVVSLYAGGAGFMYEKSQSFSHRSQII